MKIVHSKQPKVSPITEKDKALPKGKPPSPTAEPRGEKFVHPGQEPRIHVVAGNRGNLPLKFRKDVYR